MRSKPQAPQEVKAANQQHRPADQHPFRQAFSPRRMGAPDCNTRRAPFTPNGERCSSKERSGDTKLTAKVPWHKRPLPSDWTAEEVLFFTNWRNELERLHQALLAAAVDRPKLLRRARKRYMRLAYGLKETIGKAASRATGSGSVEAVRR